MTHVTRIARHGGTLVPVCGGKFVQRQGTYSINAECSCGWVGTSYQIYRTTPISFFDLAERDGLRHQDSHLTEAS